MIVGRHTYGADKISIHHAPDRQLIIGSFCSIAENVTVMLGSNHRVDHITTFPFGHIHTDIFPFNNPNHPTSRGDIVIGNDVWVARGVTIMSGVTIGSGAVIASNSHVVSSVPDYSIYGGNPARLIRYRFSPSEIKDLLEIRWWEFDDCTIRGLLDCLCSCDIQEFISKGFKIRQSLV